MIIHDHKIYIFCRWLRIGVLTAGFIIMLFTAVKIYAFPEPFEMATEREIIEHNMEIDRQNRMNNGEATVNDMERIYQDTLHEMGIDA